MLNKELLCQENDSRPKFKLTVGNAKGTNGSKFFGYSSTSPYGSVTPKRFYIAGEFRELGELYSQLQGSAYSAYVTLSGSSFSGYIKFEYAGGVTVFSIPSKMGSTSGYIPDSSAGPLYNFLSANNNKTVDMTLEYSETPFPKGGGQIDSYAECFCALCVVFYLFEKGTQRALS